MFRALSSLNPTKEGGIDGIGPRVLKFCAVALYQPIHHLFTLSLSQHCISEEWRVHPYYSYLQVRGQIFSQELQTNIIIIIIIICFTVQKWVRVKDIDGKKTDVLKVH